MDTNKEYNEQIEACLDAIMNCHTALRLMGDFVNKGGDDQILRLAISFAKTDWHAHFYGKEVMPEWVRVDASKYYTDVRKLILENKDRFQC